MISSSLFVFINSNLSNGQSIVQSRRYHGFRASLTHQPSLRFDQWSAQSVHFVVEAACVAQIVAGSIASPKRGRYGSAVDAFSSNSCKDKRK